MLSKIARVSRILKLTLPTRFLILLFSTSLEKHTPRKSKTVSLRPHAEGFDVKLLKEKRAKRKLERKLRLSNSPQDFRQFKEHSVRYSNMLIATRQKFYADKIEANSGDQKVH